MKIASYPTVFAIGHKAISDIFNGPVIVEEKIDGSQFSFGLLDVELWCRSKGLMQNIDAPDSLFQQAVDVIRTLPLSPGYIYRAEYLAKPKHNTLHYERVPHNHLIIFDIAISEENYLTPAEKQKEAERIGLECVPLLYTGVVENFDAFASLLEHQSILGGTTVEGLVVKNYSVFTMEKKIACGKYVSEKFKEVHDASWKEATPKNKDIIALLIESLKTDARWQKAVQHIQERGELEGSPRDIGKLIREVPEDIKAECEDEIKNRLFAHAWPHIQRGVIRGLPEWYKTQLVQQAFPGGDKTHVS